MPVNRELPAAPVPLAFCFGLAHQFLITDEDVIDPSGRSFQGKPGIAHDIIFAGKPRGGLFQLFHICAGFQDFHNAVVADIAEEPD